MADRLTIINEQLDELLVKQLDFLQDYITITVECESHQKEGFINIAKARYIQGFHTVSKNCLYSEESDKEHVPIVTVSRVRNKLDLLEKVGDEKARQNCTIDFEEPRLNVSTDPGLDNQLNNQFGMLSSNSLRTAKSDFRKCLGKTMERAAIVEQSLAIRDRFKVLMKEKLDILQRQNVAKP